MRYTSGMFKRRTIIFSIGFVVLFALSGLIYVFISSNNSSKQEEKNQDQENIRTQYDIEKEKERNRITEDRRGYAKSKSLDSTLTERERLAYSMSYISDLIYANELDVALEEAIIIEQTFSKEAIDQSSYYDMMASLYGEIGDEDKSQEYKDKFLQALEKTDRIDELGGIEQ